MSELPSTSPTFNDYLKQSWLPALGAVAGIAAGALVGVAAHRAGLTPKMALQVGIITAGSCAVPASILPILVKKEIKQAREKAEKGGNAKVKARIIAVETIKSSAPLFAGVALGAVAGVAFGIIGKKVGLGSNALVNGLIPGTIVSFPGILLAYKLKERVEEKEEKRVRETAKQVVHTALGLLAGVATGALIYGATRLIGNSPNVLGKALIDGTVASVPLSILILAGPQRFKAAKERAKESADEGKATKRAVLVRVVKDNWKQLAAGVTIGLIGGLALGATASHFGGLTPGLKEAVASVTLITFPGILLSLSFRKSLEKPRKRAEDPPSELTPLSTSKKGKRRPYTWKLI